MPTISADTKSVNMSSGMSSVAIIWAMVFVIFYLADSIEDASTANTHWFGILEKAKALNELKRIDLTLWYWLRERVSIAT